MKRSTILSFAGAIITVVAIIGFVAYYSNAHEEKCAKERNSTADFLAIQDYMKIPTTKYLHIDYLVPPSHIDDYAFQISDIKILGSGDGSRLQAPKELFSYIRAEQRGDSLVVKLDMRDKKWWTRRNSVQFKNKKIGPLLTLRVNKDIKGISSSKHVLRTPLTINVDSLESSNIKFNLYDCMLFLENSQLGHVCIENPHTVLMLKNIKANFVSISDRIDSTYNRTIQTKADPYSKKMRYTVRTTVSRRNCKIDTLETRYNNQMIFRKLNDIKVFRWKALNDSADVKFTMTEGVKIEHIKN